MKTIQLKRTSAIVLVVLSVSGCATNFDVEAARNIRHIAIVIPENPVGYISPYDLKMFRNDSVPNSGGGLIGAGVSGFAQGLAKGTQNRANQNAVVSADQALKFTDERLGDEMADFLANYLKESGYQVSLVQANTAAGANTDATITVSIDAVGYACDGFFLEGQCKPRINAHIAMRDQRGGKKLYDKTCFFGIKSSLLGDCSMEADSTLFVAKLSDVLADPTRSNANIREGAKMIARHVAKDLAPR